MKFVVIRKAEVKSYTRTRKGKMERVSGYQAQRQRAKISFDFSRMKKLIESDEFLERVFNKMSGSKEHRAEVVFNTYVLGDSIMESRYAPKGLEVDRADHLHTIDRDIVRPLLYPKAKDVAMTILQQMGGANRIQAMTGAKNFAYFDEKGSKGVSFDFPSRGKKPNHVKITLEPNDTYSVEFGKKKQISWKRLERVAEGQPNGGDFYTKISEHKGIYFDQLKELFEKETGLYLSLGTLGKGITPQLRDGNTQFVILEKARTVGAKDKKPRKKRGYIKVRNPDPKGEPFIWVKPKKAELVHLNIKPDKKTHTQSSQKWLDRNRDWLD